MTTRLLLITAACLCSASTALADLNQYLIRTTEWLVEHSRVICVAEFADAKPDAVPKILSTMKGDAKTVNWPLKAPRFDGYYYYGPPASGMVRLLFIGGQQELWQAVDLVRQPIGAPTLHEAFYGVDQFGRVHLMESSLMKSVRAQLAAPRSAPVTRRRSAHFDRSGIEAPPYFPFENGGETFVLVVDFNERRRDHFVKQLSSGDCAERLHAINELAQLEDPSAHAAINAAQAASGVEPSYAFRWSDRLDQPQMDAIVRKAATAAYEKIEER
ncbi:MAG: hypothetical protein KDB14_21915 [Planctomycetales bacterium]|nr:hypothetical protein [Planctomycetales bacterium]